MADGVTASRRLACAPLAKLTQGNLEAFGSKLSFPSGELQEIGLLNL